MGNYTRECAGAKPFATGNAKCNVAIGYIKAIIFVQHGRKLPATLDAASIEAACHADYPNRIYPITGVSEYAQSGGEAQTSQVGYGPTVITGYSESSDQFTLADSDMQRRASLIKNMGTAFDVYYVDADNNILGVEDDDAGSGFPLKGFPMAGIAVGGSKFKTSGNAASDILTLYSKDYAKNEEKMGSVKAGFALLDTLENSGIRLVELVSIASGKYKLVEKQTRLDITPFYGSLLSTNATTAFTNASACTYSGGALTITMSSGATSPKLASASVLQAAGIAGIEQG